MHGRRGQSVRRPPSRLPPIAPRGDGQSRPSQLASTPNNIVTDRPRARLPPRSRTGCWTCRTRKVKCDEVRPKCSQCARLGHECDYSPRLSFRDDTPRVVERNQEVSTVGSCVWDPSSPRSVEINAPQLAGEDTFPPFASLTNDEDRERKAELKAPGTYHIVVNPSSFAGLEEPSDGVEEDNPTTKVSSGLHRSEGTAKRLRSPTPRVDVAQDPDIVILRKFEDNTRRLPPWPANSRYSTPRAVPLASFASVSPSSSTSVSQQHNRSRRASAPDTTSSLLDTAVQRRQDDRLLSHYRNFVRRKIFDRWSRKTLVFSEDGATHDIFEPLFESYPPLFHAMMALSALSLADREGLQNLDALNHYQRTLPSLQQMMRSEEDLFSDGLMLTHFILLLYEIAAAQPWGTTLWSEHLEHLLRITIKRHEVNETERYAQLVWYICMTDILVALCGCGSGGFVKAMLQYGLFPIDTRLVVSAASGMVRNEESEYMSLVMNFDGEIAVMAARLGLMARQLRRDAEQQTHVDETSFVSMQMGPGHRQQQISVIQQDLRWKWHQKPPELMLGIRHNTLPAKVQGYYDHAYVLYYACIIYSHTSMYASQRIEIGPGDEVEISQSVQKILQIAHERIESVHLEQCSLVFPLFMAGFASTDAEDKRLAVELIRQMEKDSISRNTRATRELLEVIYERQDASFSRLGHSLDVDWIQVMLERGLKVVAIGL